MMFGGTPLASSALASHTPFSTAVVDAEDRQPYHVLINNVHRPDVLFESFGATLTIGEQDNASLTIVNPIVPPVLGDEIEVRFFGEVLIAGTINSLRIERDMAAAVTSYNIEIVDWAQLLSRHKVRRNFFNMPLAAIAASLLDNELAGEGLSIGTIDSPVTIPLVDARSANALDVLREAGASAGQVLKVDSQRRIHFLSTSVGTAPSLDDSRLEEISLEDSRDDYANRQTVIAEGTPALSQAALVSIFTASNQDQIDERAAVEGGSGIYEMMTEVRHPFSNLAIDVNLLARSVATIKLAVSETPKRTIRCRVRGYGFRPFQEIEVAFPGFGIAGTWLVQSAEIHQDGDVKLLYDLELTETTFLRRAYESWLEIIAQGKIIIVAPGMVAPEAFVEEFNTVGATNWVAPANTVVTITAWGGSGGGGGGVQLFSTGCVMLGHEPGGKGGNSGKVTSSVSVVAGDQFDIVIGAAGVAGLNGNNGNEFPSCITYINPTNGTNGGDTTVHRSGVPLAIAEKGGGGKAHDEGSTPGSTGGGSGGIVKVGGGRVGGKAGSGQQPSDAGNGIKGKVKLEYVV